MIRILLADDQHLVRGALAALLSLEDDMTVVGATVSDIAGRLFLSEGTVRNYLSSAIA